MGYKLYKLFVDENAVNCSVTHEIEMCTACLVLNQSVVAVEIILQLFMIIYVASKVVYPTRI